MTRTLSPEVERMIAAMEAEALRCADVTRRLDEDIHAEFAKLRAALRADAAPAEDDEPVAWQLLARGKPISALYDTRQRGEEAARRFDTNRETRGAGPYTIRPLYARATVQDAAPAEDARLLDWLEDQIGAPEYRHDLLIQSDSEDGVWFVRVRKEEKGRRGENGPFPLGFSPTLRQAIRAARAAGQEGA